jgi:hypothetical protein
LLEPVPSKLTQALIGFQLFTNAVVAIAVEAFVDD